MRLENIYDNEQRLLSGFNIRDVNAFSDVYSLLYDSLLFYSHRLFINSHIDSQDVVQDAFMKLWGSKSTKFSKLIEIKAYLFVTIKNEYKQYIVHDKYVDRYRDYILSEKDKFQIDIIENDIILYFSTILKVLPKDSAEIMRLLFEGYDIDEITKIQNKSKKTIYNKKSEAIRILKSKVKGDGLLFILLLLNKV